MEQQGRVAGLCSTGREEGSHYSDFTQGSIHRNIAQKQGIRGLIFTMNGYPYKFQAIMDADIILLHPVLSMRSKSSSKYRQLP